jgi:hypothetical protein
MSRDNELQALERSLGFVILYTTFGAKGLRDLGMTARTMENRRRDFRRLFGFGPDSPGALLHVQAAIFERLAGVAVPGADLLADRTPEEVELDGQFMAELDAAEDQEGDDA